MAKFVNGNIIAMAANISMNRIKIFRSDNIGCLFNNFIDPFAGANSFNTW